MAVEAILEHQTEPVDTSEDGLLYEFVLNSDGSTTKITRKIAYTFRSIYTHL